MLENWDSVKRLLGKERMKDIHFIEREYLDSYPNSGYFTEVLGLDYFPDYIDYLPQGAIVRKVKIMGYIPEKTVCNYSFVGLSKEEYHIFLKKAVELVIDAIQKYRKEVNVC